MTKPTGGGFRLLRVTSPAIANGEVRVLQQLLNGANHYGGDWLQGPVDGVFGPETARACNRAKFWLGYPDFKLRGDAGEQLVAYLVGGPLPQGYVEKRAARLKAAKLKPLREKALARAEKDLGMKEHPAGSNHCPISDRWGVAGPWCAMSVSEWYIDAGSTAFRLKHDFAYVPYLLAAAERGEHGLAIVRASHALPGDPVCFDWDDDGIADHVGLLRSKVAGGGFKAIEGNTAVGNDSNGGQVMHRERQLSQVATFNRAPAFVRVGR